MWAGLVTRSVGWTYTTDFRVTTERVNGGTPITFAYDPDRLVTGVGALTLTRNPENGLLTGSTLGNVTDSYTYSTFGEVRTYQATYSGTPQLAIQYTRDTLGRIIEKTETLAGVTDTSAYTYDTVGRLTDVAKNGVAAAHYEYDANGNRLSVTRPGIGTVSGTYDAQDRLTAYGAVRYTYTANGDLQTATSGGQTTTYTYDVSGNLISAILPTGTQIEYVIDGQNRRIGKKVNGTLVQGFLYSGRLRPVAEVDGAGQIVSRFVYGTKSNVPEYFVKGGVTYRIVTDHLGSPRLVINTATGFVVQRLDFDEFGQILQDTNPGFQPFGFAGGLYDADTKLTRFGARDYDAFTGRWTAKDPIRFGGQDPNFYVYAGNDSLNVVDPSGLQYRDPAGGTTIGAYRELYSWEGSPWKDPCQRNVLERAVDRVEGGISKAAEELGNRNWGEDLHSGIEAVDQFMTDLNKIPAGEGKSWGNPKVPNLGGWVTGAAMVHGIVKDYANQLIQSDLPSSNGTDYPGSFPSQEGSSGDDTNASTNITD